jgi:hypothetical protein
MAKLHTTWNQIAAEYYRLWDQVYDDTAEEQLNAILASERAPSELATTEAPNNQRLLGKWQDHVFLMHRLTEQKG